MSTTRDEREEAAEPDRHTLQADLPIACTLTADALSEKKDELLSHLIQFAADRSDIPGGVRYTFQPSSEILAAIVRTMDIERQCCRFLRFQLTVESDGGPVRLDVTGPDGTREFLQALP